LPPTPIPAHSEAANDAALRGAPLALYDWLLYRLEPHGYRPVNVSRTAEALGMKRKTVRIALRILVARGYLQSTATRTRVIAYRMLTNRDPDIKSVLKAS
jgi:DNA-binding GntR family transcriptional regulator